MFIFVGYLKRPRYPKPKIEPHPTMCPRLVLATNSGNPKSDKDPFKGRDGPWGLTFIAYLPNAMHTKFDKIIIEHVLVDQVTVSGTTESRKSMLMILLIK